MRHPNPLWYAAALAAAPFVLYWSLFRSWRDGGGPPTAWPSL